MSMRTGFVRCVVVNNNTGKREYVYSRYEVDDEKVSVEEEIRLHRKAVLGAILKRADEFIPHITLPEIDTSTPTEQPLVL